MNTLMTWYQRCLNLKDATFSRIDYDDAMVAIVYKITQSNGIQLILKSKRAIRPPTKFFFSQV